MEYNKKATDQSNDLNALVRKLSEAMNNNLQKEAALSLGQLSLRGI